MELSMVPFDFADRSVKLNLITNRANFAFLAQRMLVFMQILRINITLTADLATAYLGSLKLN